MALRHPPSCLAHTRSCVCTDRFCPIRRPLCLAVYLTAAAFVDECTSAVSVDVERRLYQAAIEMGITSITISQRLALTEFHENELRLGEVTDAGWSLHACKHGGTAPAHMRLRTRYSAARC